ncbi:putative bifunctional diguanylate cyclase/phosphodiesterase [Hoeflea poritis]|uniref:EAL domain-containing protein n=1 Tax=Hoeflea poritis TaxID=2993659 RepID=A0ABT4VJG4_9HYPH|nr:EAL domain-containing protein [Hoeflea poritis]MDA4844267.1 EAL domain-containing protein [Hoeflea poritis]
MSRLFSNIRKDPERRIRIAYRFVLIAMAGLLATSYFTLNHAIERGRHNAVAFKDLNSERVLSQRVVLLSQQMLNAHGEEQRQNLLDMLNEALTELEQIHTDLVSQIQRDANRDASSKRISDIFFSWPEQLDYRMRSLISNSRQLADLASTSPEMAAVYLAPMEGAAAEKVLPALDRIADIYRLNTRNSITQFERSQQAMLALSFALLAVIWLFLFRPLATQVGRRNRELESARDEMQYAATHDGLTGLANRNYALQRVQEATERLDSGEKVSMALLLLDLDDFKNVNDSYGHLSGDRLLCVVANRLRSVLGKEGIACRMGGDEFLVIVEDKDALALLPRVAGRILERLNATVTLSNATTLVRSSIGIARYPMDGTDAEQLLAAADLALYAAKRSGKGTFRFFNDEMQKELNAAKALEKDIDDAITLGQFKPVFQPQMDALTGRIIGVEVLVRWHHPQRGILLPGDFLDVAANLGRMPEITRLVLDQAFQAASEWKSQGIDFGRIAVNFSGHDLMWNGFFRNIAQLAHEHGLACDHISVEVVESVAIRSDNEQSARALYELRKLGIRIEIDDFGTGFASLSHLNRNLFDRVKVDRQFIANIDTCERSRIIVDSIIRLASALKLEVVAEGMERQEEIDTLLQLGCTQFQGNAIAPPMPRTVAKDWLATHCGTGRLPDALVVETHPGALRTGS